jgi:hypothetical protein
VAHDKPTQDKEKIHHEIHTVDKKRVFEFEKDISSAEHQIDVKHDGEQGSNAAQGRKIGEVGG